MADAKDKIELPAIERMLEQRLGRTHARQRLGIESDSGNRIFGKGLNFFHPENWYSIHKLIKGCIQIAGMYGRGQRNARRHRVNHNRVALSQLPKAFDGFTLLHLSDIHADMDMLATEALARLVTGLEYDLCVLTGDYRALTSGPIDGTIAGMRLVAEALRGPVYGVLGNHDSIHMVPLLEDMGIQMLLNESAVIERGGARIYLAGVDDAHYFRVDNLQKSTANIPNDAVSVLLCHTPEIYRQAAHADFNLFLCGHTHGGQICLPGGIPLTLDSRCPRFVGAGSWQYHGMQGYTSVGAGTSIVNVRFNCPPEVTLHLLSVPEN